VLIRDTSGHMYFLHNWHNTINSGHAQ
jgi:hypothetical protein